MHLPFFIAQPVFSPLYRIERCGSPIPPIRRAIHPFPEKDQAAFNDLLVSTTQIGSNQLIDYHLPYPKADFLNYLCDWRGYVAHGSPQLDLPVLQPIRLSNDLSKFGNHQQIFCSPDAIWAIWFAILDKSKIHVTQNGCVRVGRGERRIKFYHFELPVENQSDPPFVDGMVYLAKPEEFPFHRPYAILDWLDAEIEEWGSVDSVMPLAKLQVKPKDFLYLDKVQFQL